MSTLQIHKYNYVVTWRSITLIQLAPKRGVIDIDMDGEMKRAVGGGQRKTYMVGEVTCSDGIQQPQCSHSIDISCVFCQLKGNLHQEVKKK